MSGSAIADSPNSRPAADTEAAVEIDLRKVLREDIFVTATLNPYHNATPVLSSAL
jgi:hypothetical protein